VLTELSLNGVGVGNLMFRASTAQSWKAERNSIAGPRFSRNGTTPEKSEEEVAQTRTEENPDY